MVRKRQGGKSKFPLAESDMTARWAFKRGFEFALAAMGSGCSLDELRQYWPLLWAWRMAKLGRYGLADYPDIPRHPDRVFFRRFVWSMEGDDVAPDDLLWLETVRSALSEPEFAIRIFGHYLTGKMLRYLDRRTK